MLARETRPCPVAELVGVDRRVLRQVLCQLQIGAAADAGILAAVRDDRSGEIRAGIFARVLGPRILRKDLVGLSSEPLIDPFGIVGFSTPNAVLLESPAFRLGFLERLVQSAEGVNCGRRPIGAWASVSYTMRAKRAPLPAVVYWSICRSPSEWPNARCGSCVESGRLRGSDARGKANAVARRRRSSSPSSGYFILRRAFASD